MLTTCSQCMRSPSRVRETLRRSVDVKGHYKNSSYEQAVNHGPDH
eukprot:SAG22_NODE_20907_length_261_cov_1.475309_1_plen_44_part_10